MLFHLSIDADDPKRVADVFAEIWDGFVIPFPQVSAGSWMALAGDDRNTGIEVYPRGLALVETPGDADPRGVAGAAQGPSATHMAIATQKTEQEIYAICAREGWTAKYRKRGGFFGVIEVWVEGWRMVEVLTPQMQHEYTSMKAPPRGATALSLG